MGSIEQKLDLIVKSKGGKYLSLEDDLLSTKQFIKVSCANDRHSWLPTVSQILSGKWCPKCEIIEQKKLTEKAKKERSSKLLASRKAEFFKVIKKRLRLDWASFTRLEGQLISVTCKKGHTERHSISKFISPGLCSQCSQIRHFRSKERRQKRKRTLLRQSLIKRATVIAVERGGKLLSPTYLGDLMPLEWKCSQGHDFAQTLRRVEKGNWCRECKKSQSDFRRIIDLQKMALARGGQLISKEFLGWSVPHTFLCASGDRFDERPNAVEQGKWCKYCLVRSRRSKNYSLLKAAAEERGGHILSPEFTSWFESIHFQCKNGNKWWAQPSAILRGTWCRKCARGICSMADSKIERKIPQEYRYTDRQIFG